MVSGTQNLEHSVVPTQNVPDNNTLLLGIFFLLPFSVYVLSVISRYFVSVPS